MLVITLLLTAKHKCQHYDHNNNYKASEIACICKSINIKHSRVGLILTKEHRSTLINSKVYFYLHSLYIELKKLSLYTEKGPYVFT